MAHRLALDHAQRVKKLCIAGQRQGKGRRFVAHQIRRKTGIEEGDAPRRRVDSPANRLAGRKLFPGQRHCLIAAFQHIEGGGLLAFALQRSGGDDAGEPRPAVFSDD